MHILAGRLRYRQLPLEPIKWVAEVARTCSRGWRLAQPKRPGQLLAVAAVLLLPAPPLVRLVPLQALGPAVAQGVEQLVAQRVWQQETRVRVRQGWQVWPHPVAWLRVLAHP